MGWIAGSMLVAVTLGWAFSLPYGIVVMMFLPLVVTGALLDLYIIKKKETRKK